MAIATLTRCYDNPDCFKGVVKIRKGLAAKMVMESGDMTAVYDNFRRFVAEIGRKAAKTKNPGLDNKREQILARVASVQQLIHRLQLEEDARTGQTPAKLLRPVVTTVNRLAPLVFLLCMEFLMSQNKQKGMFLRHLDFTEVACVSLAFLSVVLMLSFSGIEFAIASATGVHDELVKKSA